MQGSVNSETGAGDFDQAEQSLFINRPDGAGSKDLDVGVESDRLLHHERVVKKFLNKTISPHTNLCI
jgi:hypothetical protein